MYKKIIIPLILITGTLTAPFAIANTNGNLSAVKTSIIPADTIKEAFKKITNEDLVEKKVALFNDLPNSVTENKDNTIYFEMLRENIATAYINKNEFEKGIQYAIKEKNDSFRGRSFKNLSDLLLAKKQYQLTGLLLKQGLLDARKNHTGLVDTVSYACNYARVLYHARNYQQGMLYATLAYHSVQRKWEPSITDTYVLLLSSNSRYKEAFPIMDSLLLKANISEDLNKQLPVIFAAVNGKAASYDDYYHSRTKEFRDDVYNAAKAEMISLPAPDFNAKDAEGKDISFKKLRGKTIVLDFWATWCHSCISSFPAMQLAVNRFKNDTNVVFLFVDTKELVLPNPAELQRKYFTSKNFTFRMMLDTKEAGTWPVSRNYGVVGLPTKFIIDPDGNIRFKITGVTGSDESIAEEISARVNLARKKTTTIN